MNWEQLLDLGGGIAMPLDITDMSEDKQSCLDEYAKRDGLTITYAPWHPNPQFRMFKTGTLLSGNDKYPSGLIFVNEDGTTKPWTP